MVTVLIDLPVGVHVARIFAKLKDPNIHIVGFADRCFNSSAETFPIIKCNRDIPNAADFAILRFLMYAEPDTNIVIFTADKMITSFVESLKDGTYDSINMTDDAMDMLICDEFPYTILCTKDDDHCVGLVKGMAAAVEAPIPEMKNEAPFPICISPEVNKVVRQTPEELILSLETKTESSPTSDQLSIHRDQFVADLESKMLEIKNTALEEYSRYVNQLVAQSKVVRSGIGW